MDPAVDVAAANAYMYLAEQGIVFRFTDKMKSPSGNDILKIKKLLSPEVWFHRTKSLHDEMTPTLARDTARILKLAMAPKTSVMSPETCMATLRDVEATLKRRRSERIEAKEAERAAAQQASDEATGAARSAFRLAVANRPVKRSRVVDQFGRAHVF